MTPPQTPAHGRADQGSSSTTITCKRARDSDTLLHDPMMTAKRKFLVKQGLIETDQELLKIACSIGPNWEEIGIGVGLSYTTLQGIAASYSGQGTNMMAFHMLQQWKCQSADGCSYQQLSTALEEAGMNSIARTHCYQQCV